MPSEASHLALARHNQQTLNYLSEKLDQFSDWVATVAFYKALHVVEAVFSKDSQIGHGQRHERREHLLKTNHRYEKIYRHYRHLLAASLVARYLQDTAASGQEYSKFSDYMTPEEVRNRLLNGHLSELQKSATKFISAALSRELD